MADIIHEMERAQLLYFNFKYDDILSIVEEQLELFDTLEEKLDEVSLDYSHNVVTKLQMAEFIDETFIHAVTELAKILETKVILIILISFNPSLFWL